MKGGEWNNCGLNLLKNNIHMHWRVSLNGYQPNIYGIINLLSILFEWVRDKYVGFEYIGPILIQIAL